MGVQSELKTSFAPAISKHPGSKSLQIVDIMLAAVSVWLVVKYFDAQVRYSKVIALFCRSSPLGFVAVIQFQSLLLKFFKSSAYKFTTTYRFFTQFLVKI